MKRWLAIFCMCALSGAVEAGTDPFVGSFTHDYTRLKNDPVWTVKKSGATWQVHVHGANETVRARPVSNTERAAFWEQMWWPVDKAGGAQCLHVDGEFPGLMCYVQSSTRVQLDALSKNKSDYFYFDSMGGLMEFGVQENRAHTGSVLTPSSRQ